MIREEYNITTKIKPSLARTLMVLGLLFLGGTFAYSFTQGGSYKIFTHSYLFSFIFYMSLVFGCLFFVILQHLTRSEWSVVVRRIPENLAKNVEIMILLAVPVLFGVFNLYEWTHQQEVAVDELLQAKSGYLNLPFFLIRVGVYFLALWLITRFYYQNSVKQDNSNEQIFAIKMQRWAPLTTLLYALVITFFAIDLVMSLFPHWYSTMWGVYYFSGAMVGSLALMILLITLFRGLGFLKKEVTIEHYHDLGKLLFAFNLFWSYIAFSQYMLIWYANIPEETMFFIDRINGSWYQVSILLVIGHVFFPILAYISRNAKRNLKIQFVIASWLLFMQVVDVYWVIMPTVNHKGIDVTSVDVLIFVGMGLLFLGNFLRNTQKHSILAYNDPRIKESINFINH